jgi:hypothetical protein
MKPHKLGLWYKVGAVLGLGIGVTIGLAFALLKLAILALVGYGLFLLVT